MPTLNEYSRQHEKEGSYVRASVGAAAPITLQVSTIASRIFRSVGYEGGDSLSSKLVWAMYDLDMLYTLSSVDIESTHDDINPEEVLADLDIEGELTEEERARLLAYLEAYCGPDAEHISDLREKLLENTSSEMLDIDPEEWFPERHQLPDSKEEILELLRKWTPPHLTERAEKALFLHEEFVRWSVRTFANHPRLTSTPIVSIADNMVTYELEPTVGADSVTIADARGHERKTTTDFREVSYDFKVQRKYEGTTEYGYVRDETIVHYTADGSQGNRVTLDYDLHRILPPKLAYFGLTEDKPHTSTKLRNHYLEMSFEDLKSNNDKNSKTHPPEFDHAGGGGQAEIDIEQIAPNRDDLWVAEVSRESQSGNLVADTHDGFEVVITGSVSAQIGDHIIVRPPLYDSDQVVVDTAIAADEIPDENTREWIDQRI